MLFGHPRENGDPEVLDSRLRGNDIVVFYIKPII